MTASVGAYAVYSSTRILAPVIVHSGVAMLLLAVATVYELDGPLLTIALTFEIALLVVGSLAFLGQVLAAKRASILFLVPCILVFENIDRYSRAKAVFASLKRKREKEKLKAMGVRTSFLLEFSGLSRADFLECCFFG